VLQLSQEVIENTSRRDKARNENITGSTDRRVSYSYTIKNDNSDGLDMFSGWRMIDELNKHWSGTSTGKRKAARARITWRDTIL